MSADVPDQPRKLGLLAGTFEDGSVSIFVVPYPQDLPQPAFGPVYGMPGRTCIRIAMH